MFNPKRLELARKRRKLTGKALAERAGLTDVTISRLGTASNEPSIDTVKKLADALSYPIEFFYDGEYETIPVETVSFRSMKKMTAKFRDAAISGGEIGLILCDWADKEFNLPTPDLLDLSKETDPEIAATLLRQHWGLGHRPINNMIKLLESKGVKIISLAEDTEVVDACSFWKGEQPIVILNTFKTAEHSRFDAAHELGHLILHKHGEYSNKIMALHVDPDNNELNYKQVMNTNKKLKVERDIEREADRFASSFLMPRADILANMPRFITVQNIIEAKLRWKVSAMALAYRLRNLSRISDWQYRSIIIELAKKGYKKSEPIGIEKETSALWSQIFTYLWSIKKTKKDVAAQLNIPLDEVDTLVCGLLTPPHRENPALSENEKYILYSI